MVNPKSDSAVTNAHRNLGSIISVRNTLAYWVVLVPVSILRPLPPRERTQISLSLSTLGLPRLWLTSIVGVAYGEDVDHGKKVPAGVQA